MTEVQVTTLAKKAHAAGIDHDIEKTGAFNGSRVVWGDCRIRMRFQNFCCTVTFVDYKQAEQAIRDKNPMARGPGH